ncbi:MAG: hypothetical protein IPJ85_13420 [Flavobacteriales bacterium]|nr:hypothetical protein [Flavobacteriales bacterium]
MAVVLFAHMALAVKLRSFLESTTLGLGLSIWLLGSGVLSYYAANYLPDSIAYGLVLLGWAIAIPRSMESSTAPKPLATICFALAGLIKATTSFHLITYSVILFLAHGRLGRRWRTMVGPLTSMLMVAAWHVHANLYNTAHETHYFLTTAMPAWSVPYAELLTTSDLVIRYWWSKYLHPSTWHALLLLAAIALIKLLKLTPFIKWAMGLSSLGSIGFVALFYPKLADHDYYFLTVLPAIAFIMIAGLQELIRIARTRLARMVILGFVWVLAFASLHLAKVELHRRFTAAPDSYSKVGEALAGMEKASSVLPLDAKVVVLGDNTPHGALSFIGRKGWSFPGYPIQSAPELKALLDAGATHVLTVDDWPLPDWGLEQLVATERCALWRITRP